jgi:Tfp pilus assembly protein PilV
MKEVASERRGQSLLEVLIASALGVILITGAITLIAPSLRGDKTFTRVQVGAAYGRELADKVRAYADSDWHALAALSTSTAWSYYVTSSPMFAAATGTETMSVSTTTYLRYFYLSQVSRDAGGNVNEAEKTSGYDPSILKVSVVYGVSGEATSSMVTYVTRPHQKITMQSDWSGGDGVDGPVSSFGTTYSESTGIITTSTGSIMIDL